MEDTKFISLLTVPGVISARQSKVQQPTSDWRLEVSSCDEWRADEPLMEAEGEYESDRDSSSMSDRYDNSDEAKSSLNNGANDIFI